MTKHNLKAHLSWLLNAKPFVPPAGHHIVDDCPSTSAIAASQTLALHIVAPAGDAHICDLPGPQSVVPEPRTHAHATRRNDIDEAPVILNADDSDFDLHTALGDMAKLRAAPGSTSKPRLITQYSDRKTPVATPSSHVRSNLASTSADTPKRRVDPTGSNPTRHPTQSKGKGHAQPWEMQLDEWDLADVDAIDLTGDSDNRTGSSPNINALPSTSRKRKSNQFEPDFRHGFARQRPRVQERPAEVLPTGGFVPIEEFEDPPPPYSTVAQRSAAPEIAVLSLSDEDDELEDTHDISAPNTYEVDQQRVVESPLKSVPKKRKSLSRIPSENSERDLGAVTLRKPSRSPKNVNWSRWNQEAVESRRSPSKATHLSKRRIVVDSEDEDGLDFDDADAHCPPSVSPPLVKSPEPEGPARPSTSEHLVIDKSKDFRWHECKADSLPVVRQPKRLPGSSLKANCGRTILENAVSTPSSCQASSSTLSKAEREVVSTFVGWPETHLRNICKELGAEVQRLQAAQTDYMEEYESLSVELISKSKGAVKRKGIIENLIETRNQFLEASMKKMELRNRVLHLMETEYSHDLTDFDETNAQLKVASEHLKSIEVGMIQSMRAAGFLAGEGNSVRLCDPPHATSGHVVVCSTQAISIAPLKEKQRMPGPNDLLSTQMIQQTQIPLRSPKTPRREVPPLSPAHHRSGKAPQQEAIVEFADDGFDDDPLDDVSVDATFHRHDKKRLIISVNASTSKANAAQDFAGRSVHIDENDIEDDEEALFGNNMGTPPAHVVDDKEEDYGDTDWYEEDMLDMAEDMETANDDWARESRQAFQDNSEDRTCQQPEHGTPSKKTNIKISTTMTPTPNQLQYRWTSDVKKTLKDRFHLRGFRPHQLEAINATLAGKDCFVLMPTGGGKSLCYQLPSVVHSGKTRGVTVVISPLLSLMEDQVNHLKALHVQAFYINGELSYEQRCFIMSALREPQVEKFIQVLYVTPEMLNKNRAMVDLLQNLHQRQRLARIVIDEAHCVSQWGHDFRPDYKALGEVRRRFLGVPVMALTATATENVKVDTIHNLGIQGCEVFAQSFNRPNLYYEVRSKGKREDILQNIADLIKKHYRDQSGIVYCLSRKKCEAMAQQLREKHKISAQHYHAGMEPAQKSETQREWQSGKYKVIVATIAFGMGIDKPDVRFVVHHSIPKSLEGYYQETGRAGRDGKRSGCYLFYGYQDTNILRKMIGDGDGSQQQKERQYAMLRNVVQYCENKADCRRIQVLAYFNEQFKAEECDAECDNCNSTITFEHRDFTDLAAEAVNLVGRIQKEKVTLLHCVDVFRGAGSKRIKELGHNSVKEHGFGSELERGDVERLFQRLVSEDALEEENHFNRAGFTSQYIKLGKNYRIFQARKHRIQIHVQVSPRQMKITQAKPKRKGTRITAARDDYPLSTNVSSPVQVASRIQRKARVAGVEANHDGFVVEHAAAESEAEEDEPEAFEPPPKPRIRTIAKSGKTARQKLGPPITIDGKMARLDELHQDVVENFVQAGRSECQRILMARSLRAHPFTDSVLREMAISFPETQRELMDIPGVDRQMATLYGDRFLKLIKRFKIDFESVTGQQLQQPDKVKDPNHEIIEISDEEDEEEDNGDYDEGVDLDEEESSQECRSSYFQAPPEVEAFNERYDQAQTAASRATPGPAVSRSTRPAPVINRYTSGNSGKKSYCRKGSRRSSTGGNSRSRGGVTKKTMSKKRDSGGGGTGLSKFSRKGGGGGGGSGFGGIGMMPI